MGMLALVLFAGASGVLAVETPSNYVMRGDAPTLERLLAQKDKEIAELKQRLHQLEDERWYQEAVELGVAAAVARSHLPEKTQRRLSAAIVREARKNKVDPLLVVAVIRTESAFNAFAVSPVGAMGLMQVMPATGKWLAERRGESMRRQESLFDTEYNIELGTWYLAQMIEQFGTVEKALVAYNAGPGNAKKILNGRPAFRKQFLAGYPAKVVGEFKKLRASYERQTAQRQVAQTAAKTAG